MMKFIRPQQGFSIVQGMIIAAVLAASALVATRLLTDQKLAQRGSETKDHIEQLHNVIHATLQNQDHCRVTMIANNLHTAPFSGTKSATVIQSHVQGGAAQTVFTVMPGTFNPAFQYMNGNVIISSMTFQYPGTLWNHFTNLTTGILRINYRRFNRDEKTGQGYGVKDITKIIRVVFQFNPAAAGTFLSCYAASQADAAMGEAGNISLNRDFCNGFGSMFSWDANSNICRINPINRLCPTSNRIFVGITNTGVANCQPIESWLDLNTIINPSAVGCANRTHVQFALEGAMPNQRIRIICN